MTTISPPIIPSSRECSQLDERILDHCAARLRVENFLASSYAVAGCLAALVGCMIVDSLSSAWQFRWVASTTFYFTSVLLAYFFVLRPRWRPTDVVGEAERIERRVASTRNLLVAATELQRQSCAGISASLIQSVNQRALTAIGDSDPRRYASHAKRHRAIRVYQFVLGMVIVACFLPFARFPLRAARIIAPAWDIGRATLVSIEIVQPAPANKTVPLHDALAIHAKFAGPWDGKATLQLRTAKKQLDDIPMLRLQGKQSTRQPNDLNIAQATTTCSDALLEYRVVSAGAHTRWFRLTGVPRPYAQDVRATIMPPDYAASYPSREQSLAKDNLRLNVLTESQVELTIRPAVSVAVAQVHWIDQPPRSIASAGGASDAQLPSESDLIRRPDGDTYSLQFTATEDTRFRIHLVSEETAFANVYSPTYQLTTVDDLPPKILWVEPQSEAMLINADSTVSLQVRATDELPINSAGLEISVNDVRATARTMDLVQANWESDGSDELLGMAIFDSSMDLLDMKAKPGDRVDVTSVVTDARGAVGRSATLHFTVAAIHTGDAELKWDTARFEIADRLDELTAKLAGYTDGTTRQPARAVEMIDGIARDLGQVIRQVEATVLRSGPNIESYDLTWLGEALTALYTGLQVQLHEMKLRTQPVLGEDADPLRELSQRLATGYRDAISAYSVFQIATAANQLANAQNELTEDIDAGLMTPLRLVRRQAAICLQAEHLRKEVVDVIARLNVDTARSLNGTITALSTSLTMLQREQLSPDLTTLRHNSGSLLAVLERAAQPNLLAPYWQRDYSNGISRLLLDSLPTVSAAESARSALPELPELLSREFAWRRGIRRAFNEGRGELASDYGLASRALNSSIHSSSLSLKDTQAIETAVLAVAVEAMLLQTRADIASASVGQRRSSDATNRFKASSRDRFAATVLVRTSAVRRMVQQYRQVFSSYHQRLHSELDIDDLPELSIASNLLDQAVLEARDSRLDRTDASLASVQLNYRNHAEAARQFLRRLAPTTAELARQAAYKTNQLSLLSNDLAAALSRDAVVDPELQLGQLAGELNATLPDLRVLRDALVDHAERQDLLDTSEIAAARAADSARDWVDDITRKVASSMDEFDSSDTNLSDSIQLAPKLAHTSGLQRDSAGELQALAEQLEEMAERRMERISQANGDPAQSQTVPTEEQYDFAEQLAEFAQLSSEEMLRQLEDQLLELPAMQRELSQLARNAAEQAQAELLEAASVLRSAGNDMQLSDPRVAIDRQRLELELAFVSQTVALAMEPMVEQTRQSAGQGRMIQEATLLGNVQQQWKELQENRSELSTRELASQWQSNLRAAQKSLVELDQQFKVATNKQIFSSSREVSQMQRDAIDRARRMQQLSSRVARQLVRLREQQISQVSRQATEAQVVAPLLATELSKLLEHLENRAATARQLSENSNTRATFATSSPNAAADVAGYFADLLQQSARQLVDMLAEVTNQNILPESSRESIAKSQTALLASESLLLRAGGRLARAARHERRLGNPTNADSLENIRQSISLALENNFTATAEAQVQAIAETDQKRTQTLDSTLSSAIINLTDQSARESEEIAEQLAQLLAEAPPAADASLESGDNEGNTDFQRQDASGSPQASSESSERRLLPMEQSELAQLLDELDKKLNPTAELGAQDNNSTASPVGSESSPPTSLSKAAEGIAQSLSRSRRPPERQASGDLGAATESEMADVSPQPPAQAHIVDVDRLPGSWGQLRQRNAEGTAQSQREDVPAEFREQVDAYFRRLGNASRFSNAETQQDKP